MTLMTLSHFNALQQQVSQANGVSNFHIARARRLEKEIAELRATLNENGTPKTREMAAELEHLRRENTDLKERNARLREQAMANAAALKAASNRTAKSQ